MRRRRQTTHHSHKQDSHHMQEPQIIHHTREVHANTSAASIAQASRMDVGKPIEHLRGPPDSCIAGRFALLGSGSSTNCQALMAASCYSWLRWGSSRLKPTPHSLSRFKSGHWSSVQQAIHAHMVGDSSDFQSTTDQRYKLTAIAVACPTWV